MPSFTDQTGASFPSWSLKSLAPSASQSCKSRPLKIGRPSSAMACKAKDRCQKKCNSGAFHGAKTSADSTLKSIATQASTIRGREFGQRAGAPSLGCRLGRFLFPSRNAWFGTMKGTGMHFLLNIGLCFAAMRTKPANFQPAGLARLGSEGQGLQGPRWKASTCLVGERMACCTVRGRGLAFFVMPNRSLAILPCIRIPHVERQMQQWHWIRTRAFDPKQSM